MFLYFLHLYSKVARIEKFYFGDRHNTISEFFIEKVKRLEGEKVIWLEMTVT